MEKSMYDSEEALYWAKEFEKVNPGADVNLMLTWFANTMMVARDAVVRDRVIPLEEEIKQLKMDLIFIVGTLGRPLTQVEHIRVASLADKLLKDLEGE